MYKCVWELNLQKKKQKNKIPTPLPLLSDIQLPETQTRFQIMPKANISVSVLQELTYTADNQLGRVSVYQIYNGLIYSIAF